MKLALAGLAFAGLVDATCPDPTCANTAGTLFATAVPFASCGAEQVLKADLTAACTGDNGACTAGDCCAQTCAAGAAALSLSCAESDSHTDLDASTSTPCLAATDTACVAADFNNGGSCCPASVCPARTAEEWMTAGGIDVQTEAGTNAVGVGTVSCAAGYGEVADGAPAVVCDEDTWSITNACLPCAANCAACDADGAGGCNGDTLDAQGGCATGYVISTVQDGSGAGRCVAQEVCSAGTQSCVGTDGFTTAPTALCAGAACAATDFEDGASCCPAATCEATEFTGTEYGANLCSTNTATGGTCNVECASGFTEAVAGSEGTQTCTAIAGGAEWRDPNDAASTHLECQACAANCNQCDADGAGGCDAGECATGYHIEGTPSDDGQATASCAVNECDRFGAAPANQYSGNDAWIAGDPVTSNFFTHGATVSQQQIRDQTTDQDWKCAEAFKFDETATFQCLTDGGAATFQVCIDADCDASQAAAPGTPKYSFDCENDMGWYNTIGESCQIWDTDAGYAGAFVTCTDNGYIYHDAEFVTCPDSDGDSAHTMPSECECNADYFETEAENSVSKITPVGIDAYTTGGCAPTCKFATTTGYIAGNCGTDAATADTACVPECASGYNSVAAGAATGTCLATATNNAGPGDYELSGCVDTCPAPANPTGGTYSIAGTTLSFSADNGYTCTFTDVECNPNTGAWTGIVPASCTVTADYCPEFDGENTDVAAATLGTSTSPTCATGYDSSKTYNCTAGGADAGTGDWHPAAPQNTDCELVCTQPAWDTLNIVAPATPLNILSELAILQCKDGYSTATQLQAAVCAEAGGEFTITAGECKAEVSFSNVPAGPWYADQVYTVTVSASEAPATAALSIPITITGTSCSVTTSPVEIASGETSSTFTFTCTEIETAVSMDIGTIDGADKDAFTKSSALPTTAMPVLGKCSAPDWSDLHIVSTGIPTTDITTADVTSLSCVTNYVPSGLALPTGACNEHGAELTITGTCDELVCSETPATGYTISTTPTPVWNVVTGFAVTATCADGFYESGTPTVAPCTVQTGQTGQAVYSGCSAICQVPAARAGFTNMDGAACGSTLQQGESCSRVCADGYYSASETTSWTIQCGCSANVVNWAGLAQGADAPGECLPKMCGSVDMIAGSDDTVANTTLNGMATITCRDGYSGGGVVKCVLDETRPGEVVWKYQSAHQELFDTPGYPRCAPVQCPADGQGISKGGAKPLSSFTNVAPAGTCECADNYVAVSNNAGTPQPRMSYDDDCVGNACTTPVGNTDGADFSACDGQTSSSTATCTPTKTDFTCTPQTGLWCFANGTYMANTTCTAAGNDPDGPTLEAFSGFIPLTGTYNCSTDADTFTGYETAVEDTFTGVLADRTWTWDYVADNNRITYVTDQFAVAEKAAVQTAFDTAFAVPSGPATLAGQPILAACNLTAGAPENTAGPGTDGTPAPSDPGTASSAVFCLFSMMLALFAHLA